MQKSRWAFPGKRIINEKILAGGSEGGREGILVMFQEATGAGGEWTEENDWKCDIGGDRERMGSQILEDHLADFGCSSVWDKVLSRGVTSDFHFLGIILAALLQIDCKECRRIKEAGRLVRKSLSPRSQVNDVRGDGDSGKWWNVMKFCV